MSNPPDNLEHPPFPPTQWGDCGWEGEIDLPACGIVALTVTLYDHEASRIPSIEQGEAFTCQLGQSERMLASVIAALRPYYEEMRPRYRDFLAADFERLMPPIKTSGDLLPLIDLRQVYINSWVKDGCAYVGWGFGCTWDEHGVGAMMHRDRVVEIGSADVSFAWAPGEADDSASPLV